MLCNFCLTQIQEFRGRETSLLSPFLTGCHKTCKMSAGDTFFTYGVDTFFLSDLYVMGRQASKTKSSVFNKRDEMITSLIYHAE